MKRRWTLLVELFILVGVCVWAGFALLGDGRKPAGAVDLKIQLRGAHDKAYLLRQPDGSYCYQIILDGGATETLTPDQFARRLHQDQRSRSWMEAVLNVSSPIGYAWVGIGFVGQVLFTGRMIVQWLASEKQKASVVPVSFWWMSLLAGSMLLAYFAWRRDPVGVLGQAFGWMIYVRNLWLIYVPHQPAGPAEDPAPQAELK